MHFVFLQSIDIIVEFHRIKEMDQTHNCMHGICITKEAHKATPILPVCEAWNLFMRMRKNIFG